MDKNYYQTLRMRLYLAADMVNHCADDGDLKRNHTNYGAATAWAAAIDDLGHNADLPVWEDDNGMLRIPFIGIDGEKWIEFNSGK